MTSESASVADQLDYEVIVVGAGFGGLNALYRFRSHGYSVHVLEGGGGLGGTWYWNRYPGARVDIESMEYSYAFSEELQQEWKWAERYSKQSDVLRYLEWVADRLDLRKDITFNSFVQTARFDESTATWQLTTNEGRHYRCRYCIMAVGFLSDTYWPDISGLQTFGGELIHTSQWPHQGVDLAGRRVGVIGAGATAVQLVPELAKEVGELFLFQRTPNWCFPMRNMPMPPDYEARVKEMYPTVRRLEHDWPGAGVVLRDMTLTPPSERKALEVSAEEREREYEERWSHDAIAIGGCFTDLQTEEAANDTLRQFLEKKIREIVIDQDVATLLIPEHPPFTRRPPGQYGYYETFNRENVHLVDTRSDPIASVSGTSVHLTSGAEYPLDVLICATGFDAGSGCLTRIEIRGRHGRLLREYWQDGAMTHLGMMTTGFPNFFFLNSVQSPSALFSPPLLGDYQVTYILRLIAALKKAGGETVEPTLDAETEWCTIITQAVERTLLPRANSWWLGANIPGKARQPVTFIGGFVAYKRHAEAAVEDLKDFVVDAGGRKRDPRKSPNGLGRDAGV